VKEDQKGGKGYPQGRKRVSPTKLSIENRAVVYLCKENADTLEQNCTLVQSELKESLGGPPEP